MPKSQPKIALSASRDIPFNKLVLSQANVRRTKTGISIEDLAEDIARRTLIQSLTVRPLLDDQGAETGFFEIPAGGRRYRALERLVKQKRLSRTAPIPCVVRTSGLAEEDSLAENVQRAPLHPLDQFRAFQMLRDKGRSEAEIAAAFFVSVAVVKQRLRLASVSPRLLDIYAEDGMTLDEVMAFTLADDHVRQDQVWDAVSRSHAKDPTHIRRLLTENAMRASDRRAQFVGVDVYLAAGGRLSRDLFQSDDGGWLQDLELVERLLAEKLNEASDTIRAEGWKWVEVATAFPYGHTFGLRHLVGEPAAETEEEVLAETALQEEYEQLEGVFDTGDDVPEEAERRLSVIEAALEALQDRPRVYEAADMARAGAFLSLDPSGNLKIERGFVRPEDEEVVWAAHAGDLAACDDEACFEEGHLNSSDDRPDANDNDGDQTRPLSDRLMAELTAHRTLSLRDAIARDADLAFVAALHVLCLKLFYPYGLDSCLEIDIKTSTFETQASGLAETACAKAVTERHITWARQLPKEPAQLWDAIVGLDADSRSALFAHCVSLSINAVREPYNHRPKAIAHANQLARAVGLDMAAAGWVPTVDAYLGRVTKAQILEAVREARGDAAAKRIELLKKPDMALAAETFLQGSGWLPLPLRTSDLSFDCNAALNSESRDARRGEADPARTAARGNCRDSVEQVGVAG